MAEVSDNVKLSKNNTCCAVHNCRSVGKKHPHLRFHIFPKAGESFVQIVNESGELEKVDRRKAWEMVTKVGKRISQYMKVCSLHFKKEDYILPGYLRPAEYEIKKMYLKRTAVPSLHLPTGPRSTERRRRTKASNYSCLEKSSKKTDIIKKKQKEQQEVRVNLLPIEEVIIPEIKTEVVDDLEPMSPYQDIGAEVTSGDLALRFVHLIKRDSDLTTMTGLPSFDVLRSIVKVVTLVFPSDSKAIISIEDKVIMTYLKLKQNLSFAFLASMFNGCIENQCREIFDETVRILSQVLKVAVSWQSREDMLRNLPSCFENFRDVVVVLDCIEVLIEGSNKLCCQLHTFSHDKDTHTCKILIGVTPAGHISYVSKAYGGRVSDKAIFQQSDLVKLLQRGDAIMARSGFQIDEMCEMNGWECITPPSINNEELLSEAKVHLASKMACARVHVERTNQRIEAFEILGHRLPIGLVSLIEEIFLVICATVNLSSPIMKVDQF